ncbi:GDSL esterase/lipase At4g16230-like [Musa acuminata AAA Group]|uniref:GDSL esterase/lipase At4g16230-like n=1 Tax=Musa acuminata AAA Group TaxID=214697 RepID=UPI0031D55805
MAFLAYHPDKLGFLLVMLCCFLSTTCSVRVPPANFVFGDSLVDVGNNNYITTFSKANYVPNGIDFPGHEPTGRYTNGRTIVDILGQALGLMEFTPPFLAPSTAGDVVLNGVNYASGGAGILNKTGNLFVGRINLDAQIDNFANTREDIVARLGSPAASALLRSALFSVTIGANDFINNYLTPLLSVPERAAVPPDVFVEAMIARYRHQLTRLYHLDARKLVVVNVGPIGCTPYLREVYPSATGDNCVDFPNQLARHYNGRLRDLVAELNTNLEGAVLVYADVYRIVTEIIRDHGIYGFEVADSACCFVNGRYGGLTPCGPSSAVCADRSKYVFWDPYHPSDAANVVITERLLGGGLDDISPMNVRQLVDARGTDPP